MIVAQSYTALQIPKKYPKNATYDCHICLSGIIIYRIIYDS